MSKAVEWRNQCAENLAAAANASARQSAFVGFDGFVDEIVQVVDRRIDADRFERIRTIKDFADRVAAAAGKSANLELVNQRTKIGGNGPILGDALAHLGVNVTYLGALGYPTLHPVFEPFAQHARIYSLGQACHTDALEFDDGKLLCGKPAPLEEITWANIQARFGRDRFAALFGTADLVGFVNWTMVFHMSELWEALLQELCPGLGSHRRLMFFDLADPAKRSPADLDHALRLISAFQKYFDVVLGLNEREALAVGAVLGVPTSAPTPEGVSALAGAINRHLRLHTVVVHPVAYAAAADGDAAHWVDGPLCAHPLITTGAGDHFNAGFCLGKLLGFDNPGCLLTGVATSGFYVRTARSPSLPDLVDLLRRWPV